MPPSKFPSGISHRSPDTSRSKCKAAGNGFRFGNMSNVDWHVKLTSSPLSKASRISATVISSGPGSSSSASSSSVGSLPSRFLNLIRARTSPPQPFLCMYFTHDFLVLDALVTVTVVNAGKGPRQTYQLRLHRPFLERQRIAGLKIVLPHILPEGQGLEFDSHHQPHVFARQVDIVAVYP